MLRVRKQKSSKKQGREAENSEIGVGKQGTGISRPGINFIVKVRFLPSYWHGHLGPWAPWMGSHGPQIY